MKSIRRGQHLITIMLLAFLVGFGYLVYRLQHEASFYISHASTTSLGCVYDRTGDVLFDPKANKETYSADHFIDVGNLIGDDSRQMTNTLVAQNKAQLANFSFMLGEQKDGKAGIYTTLDHSVNRKVYDAFGSKDGCAVAYNYKTGEIYVCLSKPSVNILNKYADLADLREGSLLCKVFYPTVPGSTQKISTTIAALESMGYDTLCTKSFSCSGSYRNRNGQIIRCHKDSHGTEDIYAAFANSCNPFYAQLVEDPDWSLADIEKTYRSMGYRVNGQGDQQYLDINGISAYTGSTDLSDKNDFDTQWGCMGQGTTLVSPLQMMVWQSAIANQTGAETMPYLIAYTKSVNGDRINEAAKKTGTTMFSARSAAYMRDIMLKNGRENYAQVLPGSDIGVKSGTAQVENGAKENSLLTGFVDDPDFPVAFCIVIEDRVKGEVSTSDIAGVLLQNLKNAL